MDWRIVNTAGGRTRVRVYEGGRGAPVLYLHGAGGLYPNDAFLQALSAHFHVHAPCVPGYEDSEGADRLRTMLDFTLWVGDLIDALGLEHPHLIGHSMGGMMAAEVAAVSPQLVRSLTLIASAGLWLEAHPIPDLFAKLPFELPELLFHDPERGAAMITGGIDFGSNAVEIQKIMQKFEDAEFLQKFLIDNARKLGTAGKILFPVPDRGLVERLYRVRAPTTLIWGESDRLIPLPYAEAFQSHVPHAHLVRIPAAGHMVPYEQTSAVISAIRRAVH
jgi:pimeloyl-ACP methyl ester carboxylesterase